MVDSRQHGGRQPHDAEWIGCGVASGTQPAATPAQCAAINALLPRFYGAIPRTLRPGACISGKLDYHLSDTQHLSASFNFLHDLSPNGIQTGAYFHQRRRAHQ